MAKIQEGHKCCRCNETYSSSQFYKAYSGLYSGTGYLPICKSCFLDLFNFYVDKYEDERLAMQRICMAFDLYFNDGIFDGCNDGTDAFIGNYIKRLNMTQYKNKTFSTTLDSGFDFSKFAKKKSSKKTTDFKKVKEEPVQEEINNKSVEKWGDGLDPPDYGILDSHYDFLTKANPNCDSNQEIFINDLCMTKMLQMRAIKNGDVDNYNKLTELYRKTFQQAGLKTVKDSASTEDFTIGVNAEMIEKYTPAEYYKNKKLFKDFDGLGDYCSRFILRPLRNLMHGTKDRDPEFYVKDDGDENGSEE